MVRVLSLLVLMSAALVSNGQDISITFSGKGVTNQIDSITATNLGTNQSVTLPGNATLILTPKTGIPVLTDNTAQVLIFPNPFSGRTTILASAPEPQQLKVKVQNLVGQISAQTEAFLPPGDHQFDLSVTSAGIYLVSLTTDQGSIGYKIICTDASNSENRIQYLSSESNHNNHNNHNAHNNPSQPTLKSLHSIYSLGFSAGEIIHYQCTSGVYVTIMTDSPNASKNYEVEFTACTDQDERNYPVVIIGDQTWMAGNLAYLPAASPSSAGSIDQRHYYVYGQQGSSVSDAKAAANYTTYGALYNWEAARWACPTGWHLPSDAEWTVLADYLGSSAGGKMMEAGIAHWSGANAGATNETGFGALPGGARNPNGVFASLGDFTAFWSATEYDSLSAMSRNLKVNNSGFNRLRWNKKTGYSVRCLKGDVANTPPTASFTVSTPNGTLATSFQFDASASMDDQTPFSKLQVRWDWNGDGTWDTGYAQSKIISHQYTSFGSWSVMLEVKDEGELVDTETRTVIVSDNSTFRDARDGRQYYYRTIGTQNWLVENLAYLPTVSPSSAGSNTSPYYYVFNYEGSSVEAAKANVNYTTYGVLYNFEAAKTACPAGWHLPSDEEWSTLTKHLNPKPGGKMKEAGFTHWSSPNTGANNSSGFTALPGGYRNISGGFGGLGEDADLWTATGVDESTAWDRNLIYTFDGVARFNDNRGYGFSVRCVQD